MGTLAMGLGEESHPGVAGRLGRVTRHGWWDRYVRTDSMQPCNVHM